MRTLSQINEFRMRLGHPPSIRRTGVKSLQERNAIRIRAAQHKLGFNWQAHPFYSALHNPHHPIIPGSHTAILTNLAKFLKI